MKFIIICLTYLCASISCKEFRLGHSKGGNLGAPGDFVGGDKLPQAQWFLQNLDHSRRTDLRTWKQKFYINDTFYNVNSGGPIFLMIGGEGPADPRWMVKGAWIEYAKYFGAMCIMLEHRYYGESHPTSDMSVKNMVYLSSEQALADLANFISYMNVHVVPKRSKWIVFGGSYPGSLAAWMRAKYPHLVSGAVSSSGPLLAQVDFQRYFEVVVEALKEKTGNDNCVNQVKEAHKEILALMSSNPQLIEREFRVCKPFSKASTNDMKNFYSSIADDFADVVQYNEDNRIGASEASRNITINTICKILTEPGSEPAFKRLGKINSIILNKSNQTCLDYSYDKMISDLRNISWSSDAGRQWMYQTCTEFGFYQTSSGTVSVFGNDFPVDFFIQQCEDVFGKKFNKKFIYDGAHWTNTNYGALNISASRVAYVHGTIDPWHALGMTQNQEMDNEDGVLIHRDETDFFIFNHNDEKNVGVILIKGTAHCANMYPSSPKDLPGLRHARLMVKDYILSWLDLDKYKKTYLSPKYFESLQRSVKK